jgi:hypothetical protein
MASIDDLKTRIDLHDLADKLGLERPHDRGNYKSPQHDDKTPSLSIYQNGKRWKDHSTGEGGSCVDIVCYVLGVDVPAAVKKLHELYGIEPDRPKQTTERRRRTREEYIADKCIAQAEHALPYLIEQRGIPDAIARRAISSRSVGFNDWTSDKIPAGEPLHGGPAVAFIVRTFNPGHVAAVDLRYLDPALNGGVKTQTQGEKVGAPWTSDLRRFEKAKRVYVCESPINALSIEACEMPWTAAIATRGALSVVPNMDWRFLLGKEVVIVMDNDEPDPKQNNLCPGAAASWIVHEQLTSLNVAAYLVDQGEWTHNDVNDILREEGAEELKRILRNFEPWAIPGVRGDDKGKGKVRVFLPPHDFGQYWRYRAKEDFTRFIAKRKEEDGQTVDDYQDLAGFRLAGLSRVTIASAVATMTGDRDNQPLMLFSISVQTPHHGAKLVRRVFKDDALYNIEAWKKLGPVFNPAAFLRLVTIWSRAADIGARHAINFVGLAWRDGKPIVNEGPDCYFTEPEKQCPYHNLVFPSGSPENGRAVIEAYQATFRKNAAAFALVWVLGAHLKAFLGFWPHLIMQADKGAGKSTLIKRIERSLAMTMFSRQTISTEFRIVTSVSHTSHPVGWEEISAGRQDIIDKAVSTLQECYQYTITRRGSDMTEYLLCAPVLLAGEDVPVRSLLGKVVHTDLTAKKGAMMPEDLPRFPVLQWLKFLAGHTRQQVRGVYDVARRHCIDRLSATKSDAGAQRMVENYAAVLTSWRLLCEFTETDPAQGDFEACLLEEMNNQVLETTADREPWVWILETTLSEIDAGRYQHPYTWDDVDDEHGGEPELCLIIRTSHIMDHLAHTSALRDKWNSLPVKSDRVFKRQLKNAGVVITERTDITVAGKRYCHAVAISVPRMARFGLYASPDVTDRSPAKA